MKKNNASITSRKNDTVEKVYKLRENVTEKVNAYITSTKKKDWHSRQNREITKIPRISFYLQK